MKVRIVCFIISCVIFSGCSDRYNLFQDDACLEGSSGINKAVYEYKISPQDRVVVNVSKQFGFGGQNGQKDEKSQAIQVSQLGSVDLPLLGNVTLGGYTEKEATVELTNLFSKYIRDPFVTVEIVNKRVYVLGEVKNPGIMALEGDYTTIVEAVAASGGFTDYAVRSSIKILRGDINDPQLICLDLTKRASLINGDGIICPNDVLYVEATKSRGFNIAIRERLPSIDVIQKLLSVFVNIKYLND